MGSIKCPECGKFIKETASYCIHCGTTFKNYSMDDDEKEKPDAPPSLHKISSLGKPDQAQARDEQQKAAGAEKKTQNQSVSKKADTEHKAQTKPDDEEDYTEDEDYQEESYEDDTDSDPEDEDYDDPEDEYEDESYIEDDEDDEDEEPDEDDEEDDEDELEDDEEMLAMLLGENESEKKDSQEQIKKQKRKKLSAERQAKESDQNIKSVLSSSIGKTKSFLVKKQEEGKNRAEEKPSPKKKYVEDVNTDGYYDNVIEEVDARISHILKENVIHTLTLVIVCIIIIVFMIYCIVL